MPRLQVLGMPSFNGLPYELREQIIINALYRIYTIDEMDDALMADSRFTYGLTRASIKLGQRTLKALKLTSRRMYIEAAEASRIWLDYETIDLLEELETITARLFIYAIDCGSRAVFDFTKSRVDEYRCSWISKAEIRTVVLYKRRLDEVELRTWKRLRSTLTGTETIEGFCEFMNMVERQDSSQEVYGNLSTPSRHRYGPSRRQKLLTVRLHGVDVGPDADYTPGTDRSDRWVAAWKRQRMIPVFRYGVSVLRWFRPYQQWKVFQTLEEGLRTWETRMINVYGITSEEYKQFVKLSMVQKIGILTCQRVPGVTQGMVRLLWRA